MAYWRFLHGAAQLISPVQQRAKRQSRLSGARTGYVHQLRAETDLDSENWWVRVIFRVDFIFGIGF